MSYLAKQDAKMGEDEREKLTQTILENQKQLFDMLHTAGGPDLMGVDLTMPQFKILCMLYSSGPMRMSGLARTLGKNISTTTGVVDHLVEARLIQRQEDPEDRRAVVVSITAKGYDLCDTFMQQGWRELRALLAHLEFSELKLVEQSFNLFIKAAQAQAREISEAGLKTPGGV